MNQNPRPPKSQMYMQSQPQVMAAAKMRGQAKPQPTAVAKPQPKAMAKAAVQPKAPRKAAAAMNKPPMGVGRNKQKLY